MSGAFGRAGVALALALACALAIVTGTFAIPAAAGDNVAIFALEPAEIDAESGGTVELSLVVGTHGDYAGNGIDELSATLAYDPAVFSVAEITHEGMLAQGDPDASVDGSATVDDGDGTVTIEQERDPSGDGAATTAPAATVRFDVAPDARTANETIEVAETSAILVTDYPQGTTVRDATVAVEAAENPGEAEGGVTDAIPTPGFGAGAVLAAVALTATLAAIGRSVWRR
ncbi:hypothetical protein CHINAEXTREME_15255 [Halobiforma lacisalsi AJ5]|uniref:Cohesin domain-containing protein n=1 Tax=Natronobacterium lacisalsi AJ5 TaxID=358396 RepID=M0LH38_NATLA|nr:hypothetical protein [Halobiforma lacisalsi]APW99047.1 hypothetical protein CHINAEXTREME_15255 [Halobiforma lacisalsi AJ5]EMA31310.1 hypothetical protein C445_14679 [Halobiforma lacisalsi AJ5]